MSGLTGKRILVTRPRRQADDLYDLLEAEGAEAILFPTIEIAPLDDPAPLDRALNNLAAGDYNWVIFTSVNGVNACQTRLQESGHGTDIFSAAHIAAIGPATARTLQTLGVRVDFVPQEYVAERILGGLGNVAGQRILLPRAEIARPALAEALAAAGALVDEIPVYHTLQPPPDPAGLAALQQGLDVITFTSSSTVRNFVALTGTDKIGQKTIVACIGPITAGTARELGLPVHIVARDYTIPGLVQALKEHFDDRK
jgi:uroporphyrinogen-III synthase